MEGYSGVMYFTSRSPKSKTVRNLAALRSAKWSFIAGIFRFNNMSFQLLSLSLSLADRTFAMCEGAGGGCSEEVRVGDQVFCLKTEVFPREFSI